LLFYALGNEHHDLEHQKVAKLYVNWCAFVCAVSSQKDIDFCLAFDILVLSDHAVYPQIEAMHQSLLGDYGGLDDEVTT